MFGNVVMGIPSHDFEQMLFGVKEAAGVKDDSDLSVDQLKTVVEKYKSVYRKHGKEFATDPYAQLHAAIFAVFNSWKSDRAIKYREAEGITGLLGTAVNVQAMVFGNMGPTSGTGVCFSRNPNTGEKHLYGEYLINAQGEDVVAGIRTPSAISTLKDTLPKAYDELVKNVNILEKHFHDMQDIEFTIQEGRLFMLQTRSGKRVGPASVKIAVDMVDEGLATGNQALMMVKPEHLNQLLHPQFQNTKSKEYKENVLAKGLPASPGAAVGKIVFSPEDAEALHAKGERCILVRDETSPEDVGGMWASAGVLTARGGMTSHAAVVARGWGKPCVCGCDDLKIDYDSRSVTFFPKSTGTPLTLKEGDWLSLNGDTGEVIKGKQSLSPPSISSSKDTVRLMQWVDMKRTIKVLANADTPADAAEARKNGAEGVGLTRTEHMFFSDERIRVVRRMILSKDKFHRQKALEELLPYQRSDFEGILEAMDGLPVTVRLLDPPLHEFLPAIDQVDEAFAKDVGMTLEECVHTIERMEEVNPMLGLRGCRLGIVMPELIEMQARALAEAALNNKYNKKLDPRPEIMIPLVGSVNEFKDQKKLIRDTFNKVFEEREGQTVKYRIGTMIEVPRAALTAKELVEAGAEFFSFGTNDLTQMTFGFSRDDVGGYLPTYLKKGILDADPFQSIDVQGVGQLIKMSAEAGRRYFRESQGGKAKFKAGICGEHGGDPKSVRFFVRNGLNYVSCSPFRVPVARLAAAQAAVELEIENIAKNE
jgi:pyruvate,orthophosphate dikinase